VKVMTKTTILTTKVQTTIVTMRKVQTRSLTSRPTCCTTGR
jgi:hypothetical protein